MWEYSKALKAYVQENQTIFFDLFSYSYDIMLYGVIIHAKDGCHLSERGNEEFAKLLLCFFGVNNIPERIEQNGYAKAIEKTEQIERSIQYVKWAMFHPTLGYRKEQIKAYIDEYLCKKDLPVHKKQAIEVYLRYGGDVSLVRKELLDVMKAKS